MPIFNQALIIFNKDKTRFTIPRKNTDDYNEVMRIMSDLKANAKPKTKAAPKKETKPRQSKAAKTKLMKTDAEIMKPKTDTTLRG